MYTGACVHVCAWEYACLSACVCMFVYLSTSSLQAPFLINCKHMASPRHQVSWAFRRVRGREREREGEGEVVRKGGRGERKRVSKEVSEGEGG